MMHSYLHGNTFGPSVGLSVIKVQSFRAALEQIASLLYAAIASLVKPGATFNSLIYREKTLFSSEERPFSVNSWERSRGAVADSGLDWRTH